jgi:hypothetical protein
MSEELNELREHAEEAKHDPSLVPVTMTMAVLAVLVATVSLLGHRSSTEEVILQNKVTDQWSHYQAKDTRRHNDELIADLTGIVAPKDAEASARLQEKIRAEAERYRDDQKELGAKGRELEQEFGVAHRKTDRLDLGEVFLEIALVITSITLLSGRRVYWHLGLLFAAAGILIAVSAWIVH